MTAAYSSTTLNVSDTRFAQFEVEIWDGQADAHRYWVSRLYAHRNGAASPDGSNSVFARQSRHVGMLGTGIVDRESATYGRPVFAICMFVYAGRSNMAMARRTAESCLIPYPTCMIRNVTVE